MHRMSRRLVTAMLGALLPLALGGNAMASAGSLPAGQPGPLSAADVVRLSADANQRSIIVLRNQHRELPAKGASVPARTTAVDADQRQVKSELSQLHATTKGFHVVNAVAATISKAEASRLAANPSVQAVVPDVPVQRVQPKAEPIGSTSSTAQATAAAQLQQLCPTDPNVPLLEPEALQLMHAESQTGSGVAGAHDLVDGTGVKVAFIADGLDIQNADLTRGGQSIVFDYRDFSGDGVAAPTGGGEAFGDAGSIAAQGNQTYDLSQFVNPSHPLPPGCNIRIKGVAPGVTLAALKIFGSAPAFDSMVIQAIDWAVEKDHVDVINESFGANPFPDTQNDPVQIANANAVAAGVTVVASSGDSGFTNTIGDSSGTNPVISAGGTTQLRVYRQEGAFGSQLSAGGWIDNNPSALSSSGFTQFGPKLIDVVAPGDLGWSLCSTNTAIYANCRDNNGRPASIEVFGGTSESSPLIAGEAALVIQAYRKAHGGASPSPDLVKRLITSTADDLGIPGQQQGAGLGNALKAVQAAMSVQDGNGSPAAQGSGLLLSQSQLQSTARAGMTRTFHVDVTNTGSTAQTVTPSLRRLTDDVLSNDTGSLALTPGTAPTFVDSGGRPAAFVLHSFDVPQGAQRLNAEITWAAQAQPASTVRETLFDPFGRLAMYSLPQGAASGFGHVDVANPVPGTWTAVIWTLVNSKVVTSQYSGSVNFTFNTQKFGTFGSISPRSRTLKSGQTSGFDVRVPTSSQPGDTDASLVFDTGGDRATVPVGIRSLIPIGAAGGEFSGALQGGNGRSANNAQEFTYQFDVPHGKPALNLGLTLRDPNYRLTGFMVDPNGESLDIQSDAFVNAAGQTVSGNLMQFFMRNPMAGRWAAVLRLSRNIDGARFSEPFTGQISFAASSVMATGVPNSASTVLTKGTPVTATVQVTNAGLITKDFFVDPRLAQRAVLPLLVASGANVGLPLRAPPSMIVPTHSDQLIVVAQGSVPILATIQPNFGNPKIVGVTAANNFSIALDSHPQVTPGFWFSLPEEVGPFDPSAPAATANVSAVVDTQSFDSAVVPSSGDIWQQAVNATAPYTPVTLAPGATGTISVVITPNAPVGTVVRGTLEISTFNPFTASGDQVVSVPYTYRVG
jgi:hypothetical protein